MHAIFDEDESNSDNLIWKGETLPGEFQVPGRDCRAIQPDLIETDDGATLVFSRSLMIDLGIQIKPSTASTQDSNPKRNNIQH